MGRPVGRWASENQRHRICLHEMRICFSQADNEIVTDERAKKHVSAGPVQICLFDGKELWRIKQSTVLEDLDTKNAIKANIFTSILLALQWE